MSHCCRRDVLESITGNPTNFCYKGVCNIKMGFTLQHKSFFVHAFSLDVLNFYQLIRDDVNVYALYYKLQLRAPGHVARVCRQY